MTGYYGPTYMSTNIVQNNEEIIRGSFEGELENYAREKIKISGEFEIEL